MSRKAEGVIQVALAGNPNCGKTVIFNALTGGSQRVGNWPGVTVDKKEGDYYYSGRHVDVVDLPGTYSLWQVEDECSVDKSIAADFLVEKPLDVLINVVDASHLSRHLYLTLQLIERQIPMIIVLNMMDMAEHKGISIDHQQLSYQLGCPVIPLVASETNDMTVLKAQIDAVARQPRAAVPTRGVKWPAPIEACLTFMADHWQTQGLSPIEGRWLGMQYFEEGDQRRVASLSAPVLQQLAASQDELMAICPEEVDMVMADCRYGAVDQLVNAISQAPTEQKTTWTDRIDRWVLHRGLGIPVFLAMMYCLFFFSVNIAGAFQDFFDIASAAIFIDGTAKVLSACSAPHWLIGLVSDGIGTGINTTVTFIPVIGGMFLFLSFLEDSGYMARAAFVMDRLMSAIGLPGESFVPMIVGFGCNVPAVMGARTLSNPKDRIITVLMMPFMSCGARLAIFSVFVSAFFSSGGQNIIFMLYFLGIAVAIVTGLCVRKWLLPGRSAPLVMELPAYHFPKWSVMCRLAGLRLKHFVWRAGKVIVPVCVLMGGLNTLTVNHHGEPVSWLSVVAQKVTPVLAPMGVDASNWPATVGLVTGVMAKEVVVGTLNTLYGQDSDAEGAGADETPSFLGQLTAAFQSIPDNMVALGAAIINPIEASAADASMNGSAMGVMARQFTSQASVLAYLIFILLYVPCISTVAAMRREVGRSWMWFSVAWSTGLAYGLAVVCYQCSMLLQSPWVSLGWSFSMLGVLAVMLLMMRGYLYHQVDQRQGACV